ncbi:MAG: PEP-CTERM sorting domain-containing protein [Sphingomonadaceae bacterium]
MNFVARKAVAGACLVALAGPVWANATSTATFGLVTVTLTDLNPDDGIAPSIAFLSNPVRYAGGAYLYGEAETGLYGSYDPGHDLRRYDKAGSWQTTNVRGAAQTGLASAVGEVLGDAGGVGFSSLSVTGTALSGDAQSARYYSYAGVPNSHDNKQFILSPYTQVTFSVQATLSAQFTLGYTAGALEGESAGANLALFAGGLSADGHSMLEDLQQHGIGVNYLDGTAAGGASESWSGLMAASYSNWSGHNSQGQFWADGAVGGHSVMLSPVPEPASYGLLLSGLGVLAGVARRRRRA